MSEEKAITPPAKFDRDLSERKIMAAVVAMRSVLAGLSSREMKEALTMVASTHELRVVSANRPIGLVTPAEPKKTVKTVIKPKKASWKEKPEWKTALADRATLVASLKASPPESQGALLQSLRAQEAEMKTLKQSLQGNGVSPSQ
jgi:hypothetical protein